jgi:catechol 2,3-dioxygenase-like lactoylglutathione lyase family enzyme
MAKTPKIPDTKIPHTKIVALDHISCVVRHLEAARAFYGAALGAIGMKVNMEVPSAFGMGSRNEKIFWLSRDRKAGGGGHYAFRVDHRQEVDAFHAAALGAGGRDNGKPGLRPDYGPSYYAAFVKDSERNNIEVVCYARQPRRASRAER